MPSTYYNILTSVQTQIATVVSNSVLRRKLFYQQSDTLPIVYVVPDLPGGESIPQQTFNKGVWWKYPVHVCYVQAGSEDLITGLQTFLETREKIRDKVYQMATAPITTVTGVFKLEIAPDPTRHFQQWLGDNFDISGWTLNYYQSASRTS